MFRRVVPVTGRFCAAGEQTTAGGHCACCVAEPLVGADPRMEGPVIIFALDPTLFLLCRTRRRRRPARYIRALVLTLISFCLVSCIRQTALGAEIVSFHSGDKILHGLLYKPSGKGPFPAVLFNHGSAPGMLNNQAFELIGPMFAARGWAFFAPYRRGQGLSSDAGAYVMDEIHEAQAHGGETAAAEALVRLLNTTQLQDQIAALAWLKEQSFVRPGQIAAMGNSFGGIETVLGVGHGGYCAGVDAAGGAESWDKAPPLKDLMVRAVQRAKAPIFFIQAENDYSVAPSRTLSAAMQTLHESTEIRIYPPYGSSPQEGHSFAWRGAAIWMDDVSRFLQMHCGP